MFENEDGERIFQPEDCNFSLELDDYYDNSVAVFIGLKDESYPERFSLGSGNIIGLPEYFPSEAAECYWVIEDTTDIEKIKSHMIMCGFTYDPIEYEDED